MRRRIDQLLRLTPADWWMLVKLQALLPGIGAALHLLDYQRTCELLRRGIPKSAASSRGVVGDLASERAHRIARLVGIAANHGLYRATCLRQSLALWWLLRRRSMPAELRIGVRKDAGDLQAHAWVELGGQVLHDGHGVTAMYSAFDRVDTEAVAQP